MSDNDIKKIREILHYKGMDDLSELLSQSKSKVQVSSSYGSKLNSILSTFEIYSSIEYTEMLRKLSKEEHDLIFSAVKEVYPIRESSPKKCHGRLLAEFIVNKYKEESFQILHL